MTTLRALLIAGAAALVPAVAASQSAPAVGEPAPTFSLPDTHGVTHDLADYRGQWVVLEWLNYGCPYVMKHYRTENIPGQQEKWTDRGVVWLSVVSSAPGKQGYHEPEAMNEESDEWGNAATAVLMAPIGVSVAEGLGASVDPFLMGVAIAASSTYLTPIGHQSNLLVMGPGGYKFGDYWRMGLPLDGIILLVSVPLIMWVWPL